jgi:hypothetical protein
MTTQPAAGDSEDAIAALDAAMDRLAAVIEEETECARKGRLRETFALEARKTQLARDYGAAAARVKAARPAVAQRDPQAIERLRQRHESLQALLQKNLTVLATAHAVAEGIVRGVSAELTRRRTPSTYGASGRANAPNPRASQPIAVSRAI